MSEYQVTLFGVPGVLKNGATVRFPYRKAEGIFYYLCVEKNTNRDELISIFWGAGDENSGRKNLRQALFQIRRCLGDDVIVLQGRNDLKLNQKAGIRTEWDRPDAEFALGRERFLDFFYLKDCPEFEHWVEKKRELQISRSLDYIKRQLKSPTVCREAFRLHSLIDTWSYWKPWDEEMVLTGMKCYAQAEKYDLGLQLYHEYVDRLKRDLDEEPSHQVEVLFRTLLHRKEVSLGRKTDRKNHFFGRLTELQFIDEQIFLFLNNERTKSIIIEGEVGVGKTELMQQIFEMNRGTGILELVSHCYGAESDVPLRSWRDLFKQLEDLLKEKKIRLTEDGQRVIPLILNGMASENQDVVRGGNGEPLNYTALESRVLNLLKELAAQWKVILYFDSLHWMDTVSQRMLQRIMIELGNRQVFMVATCRNDGKQNVRGLLLALSERGIITTLPLSCFTQAEMEEVVREVLGHQNREINVHELFLSTEGNPLVLMETLNMIQQEGWKKNGPLPRIDMLIQLRLERLTGQQRKVLDALSVHMEHADLEDLELLVEMNPMELIEVLEQLISAGFVVEQMLRDSIIYKFRHQFYKNYVYQHLSLGKKRLWHRAIAESYEIKKAGERWRVFLPFTIRHYECAGEMERANALRQLQSNV